MKILALTVRLMYYKERLILILKNYHVCTLTLTDFFKTGK